MQVELSQSSHPELLQGIGGAGAAFGVVTELTFTLCARLLGPYVKLCCFCTEAHALFSVCLLSLQLEPCAAARFDGTEDVYAGELILQDDSNFGTARQVPPGDRGH